MAIYHLLKLTFGYHDNQTWQDLLYFGHFHRESLDHPGEFFINFSRVIACQVKLDIELKVLVTLIFDLLTPKSIWVIVLTETYMYVAYNASQLEVHAFTIQILIIYNIQCKSTTTLTCTTAWG